jgi:peptidylprolyl isomerase domain and WD repeat-containing protein 1
MFKKSTIFQCLLLIIVLSFISFSSCKKKQNENTQTHDTLSVHTENTDKNNKKVSEPKFNIPKERAIITDKAVIYTSKGKITIGLYGNDAPKTVENILGLIKRRYYNSVLFHRVARNFLIQTGDGLTKFKSMKEDWGTGGESIFGQEFEDELNPETPSFKIGYVKGAVAMANRGPNSNTSQFFICLDSAENLEHKWTLFGRVLDGMNIVEKIASLEVIPGPHGPADGIPKQPVRITYVKVLPNKR